MVRANQQTALQKCIGDPENRESYMVKDPPRLNEEKLRPNIGPPFWIPVPTYVDLDCKERSRYIVRSSSSFVC
eukprot:scaffold1332_cov137-Skeletonema_menzelii.AAC.8